MGECEFWSCAKHKIVLEQVEDEDTIQTGVNVKVSTAIRRTVAQPFVTSWCDVAALKSGITFPRPPTFGVMGVGAIATPIKVPDSAVRRPRHPRPDVD